MKVPQQCWELLGDELLIWWWLNAQPHLNNTRGGQSHGRDNPFLWASQSGGSQHSWPPQKQLWKMDSANFPTFEFFRFVCILTPPPHPPPPDYKQPSSVFCCHGGVDASQQGTVDVVTHSGHQNREPQPSTTHTHRLTWIWGRSATCTWLQHCYQSIYFDCERECQWKSQSSVYLTLAVLSIPLNSLFSCSSNTGLIQNPIKIRPLFTACSYNTSSNKCSVHLDSVGRLWFSGN